MVKCESDGCVCFPQQDPVLYRSSLHSQEASFLCREHFVEEFGEEPQIWKLGLYERVS